MSTPLDRRLVSLLLLLALLAPGCEAPEVVPRTPQLVTGSERGGMLGPRADLLRQVEAVKEKLAGDVKPVGILVALGNLYYENGRYPEAIDWYRQAIERGTSARERLRALDANRAPLRENDVTPEACTTRADATSYARAMATARELEAAGDRRKERACLRRALALLAGAHARRGSAWAVLEQTGRGIADIEAALEILPDGPEPLFLYGAVIFNSSRGAPEAFDEKARTAWTRFLEVAPDHPRAQQVRGALETLKAREVLPAGHPDTATPSPDTSAPSRAPIK